MNFNKTLSFCLATGLIAMSTAASADNLLERIATALLADKFGIDTRQVVNLQQQTNLSVYELAPVYEGAHYFKQQPSTVWRLRQQGLGWGQIAQRIGMQPGRFNKLRNQGAFDRDHFWTTTYRDRFSVPTQTIQVVRQRGGTLEDVLGSIVIGKLTNKSPQQVYEQYLVDRSWTTISNNYKAPLVHWQRVAKPTRTRYMRVQKPASQPKTKLKKSPGQKVDHKNKAKGKSDVRGKGNSKAKGNVKGNAGGKGKGKGKGG